MDTRNRIIVVGAGLAGLGAARALAARDFDVVVLEARDRLGGRCHTSNGIDLGAHWIHSTDGNPITNLARELGVETLFVGGDSSYTGGWEHLMLIGPSGQQLPDQEKLRSILLSDEVLDGLDTLRRQHADDAADMPLGEALAQVIAQKPIDDASRVLLDWHITLSARDDYGAGEENLSFLWWDDGYEVYGYGDSVVMKGYGAIIERLADGLDIRTEHVVERIEYHSGSVRVVTDRGVFEGDTVIVTLPLGVLKSDAVVFEPPLPEHKRNALQQLAMANLTKITARFDAPFWPRDQYIFGSIVEPIADYPTMVINLWKTHRIPALQMLVGGDKGRAIERWSDDETREWVLHVLRHAFGDRVVQPAAIERTAWDSDPFSLGSYTYIRIGGTPAAFEALAEPIEGRVLFAGEATYRYHWGCTQGAYVSGLREAARIAGDPNILPPRHFTENRRWRAMMLRASRFFNALSQTISGAELAERVSILADGEVFSVVPNNELQILAMMFEPIWFDDGQVICRPGDPATQVYAVAEGEIEVQLPDGRPIRVLRRGGVVGEYGMFGSGTRTATLLARGRCHALALDYQRFHRFLLAFPESALALMRLTVEQLLSRNEMLQALQQ